MNFIISETHSAISIRSANLWVSWLKDPKIKQVLLQCSVGARCERAECVLTKCKASK